MHFANKKKIFESFFNRVIFFDSCWKGFNLNESYCSKRVQFCESCLKRVQICKKMWKSQKINSWSPFVKRVQFFESHSKKCSVFFESYQKNFKPLGHILSKKKFTSLSQLEKQEVQFFELCWKVLGSVGSYQKNSLLCIISQKFNPFFGSNQKKFNPVGHIFK